MKAINDGVLTIDRIIFELSKRLKADKTAKYFSGQNKRDSRIAMVSIIGKNTCFYQVTFEEMKYINNRIATTFPHLF